MIKTTDEPVDVEAPAKTRTAGPGLIKPYTPPAEFAAVVGPGPMPRTEVVAKVWGYTRKHGCRDPADKRRIIADDKLRTSIGQDRCIIEMQKLLSPHLTAG